MIGCLFLKIQVTSRDLTLLFARNLSFKSRSGNTIIVSASDEDSAANKRPENQTNLEGILRASLNENIDLVVVQGESDNETLKQKQDREHSKDLSEAQEQIEKQEIPILLKQEFGAKLEKVTLRPE